MAEFQKESEAALRVQASPGVAVGVLSIDKLGDAFICHSDSGSFGPFFSFDAAILESEFNTVTVATKAIECSAMDSEKIAALLVPSRDAKPGFKLRINDESWEFDQDLWLRRSRQR